MDSASGQDVGFVAYQFEERIEVVDAPSDSKYRSLWMIGLDSSEWERLAWDVEAEDLESSEEIAVPGWVESSAY
jgi:hypothetical protein